MKFKDKKLAVKMAGIVVGCTLGLIIVGVLMSKGLIFKEETSMGILESQDTYINNNIKHYSQYNFGNTELHPYSEVESITPGGQPVIGNEVLVGGYLSSDIVRADMGTDMYESSMREEMARRIILLKPLTTLQPTEEVVNKVRSITPQDDFILYIDNMSAIDPKKINNMYLDEEVSKALTCFVRFYLNLDNLTQITLSKSDLTSLSDTISCDYVFTMELSPNDKYSVGVKLKKMTDRLGLEYVLIDLIE